MCPGTNIIATCYFDEPVAEINKISVGADCMSSLAADNFLLRSAKNADVFSVSYQVSGCPAVPPCIPCATNLIVVICMCDAAQVVALATQLIINGNANFCATVRNEIVTVTNATIGIATAAVVCMGLCDFVFNHVTESCNRLVGTICLSYDCMCQLTRTDRSFIFCFCDPSGA